MSKHEHLRASLDSTLQRLRARERRRTTLLLAERGAFYGCVAAVVIALVAAVARADWTPTALLWSPGLLPLFAMAGALMGWLRRVDDLNIARALDRAADSADRFASAVQLGGHHRTERVQLVLEDALGRVGGTREAAALPIRAARELKWLPVPAIVLTLLLWLAPGARQVAQASQDMEVSPDEWQALQEHLDQELADLPEPQTPEEREIADQLEKLAEMLKDQPDKKEALAEIARLRAELEKKAEGTRDVSMRQAAQAIRSSAALARFASLLKAGDYQAAAAELEALADQLSENQLALSAEDFEAAASDLDDLAKELADHNELGEACRGAASAASRMNRDELARALKRLSKSLNSNAKNLRKCDSLCRSRSLLDDIARRLSQCKGGKCGNCAKCGDGKCNGNCAAFVRNSDKKGGLRAGWGTASKWNGGRLSEDAEQRLPVLAETPETAGEISVTPTVSPDERADSTQDFKDMYVEMVRKAEADLELETVPPALRDYLRRYFVAIKPSEDRAESNLKTD